MLESLPNYVKYKGKVYNSRSEEKYMKQTNISRFLGSKSIQIQRKCIQVQKQGKVHEASKQKQISKKSTYCGQNPWNIEMHANKCVLLYSSLPFPEQSLYDECIADGNFRESAVDLY